MKKIIFYLFMLGFLPGITLAQANFKPGYLVLSAGDTLKGFIDYRSWEKNPSTVNFKKNLTEHTPGIFTPDKLKAFAVTGLEYYYRYTVNISQDQVVMSNIKQGEDTSFVTKTVFLHMLSSGKNVSLFDYTDDIKTRYYILDGQNSEPRELIYKVFYSAETFTQVQTSYAYRSQLEFFANKYNANSANLDHKIEVSQYSESDLVDITRLINRDPSKQFTPKSRFGFGWVAAAGIDVSNLDFPLANYPYKSSLFPRISVGLDLFPNVNTQKVILRAEFSYTQSTHSFFYGPNSVLYSSFLKNLTQNTVSFTPQVVFNLYNTERLQIFVAAAIAFNFSSYNQYYLSQTTGYTAPQLLYQFPEMAKIWTNFPLKAGVTINRKIEFFGSYSPSALVTPSSSVLEGHEYEYEIGVGYRFGDK